MSLTATNVVLGGFETTLLLNAEDRERYEDAGLIVKPVERPKAKASAATKSR